MYLNNLQNKNIQEHCEDRHKKERISVRNYPNVRIVITVEIDLFRLIGTARHPDVQKIWVIGFFFENRLHWQFEFRLLIFTACTWV